MIDTMIRTSGSADSEFGRLESEPHWSGAGHTIERAALALGRLDAALDGHPLRPGWQFRTELDAACRCAAADGHRVDPVQFAVVANGLTLDPEARHGSVALAWALEIRGALSAAEWRRWSVPRGLPIDAMRGRRGRPFKSPDPARLRLRLIGERQARTAGLRELRSALDMLRAAGGNRPVLLGAALGAHGWLDRGGSRNALRGALPLFLAQRSVSRTPLYGLTGAAALDGAAPADRDRWIVCFLTALADEAADGLLRLRALERAWTAVRRRLDAARQGDDASGQPSSQPALRSSSRLPHAVDLLAATPLLGPAALGRSLGITRAGASRMLARLAGLEMALEITGRGSHKLYALPDLAGLRGELRRPPPRRPAAAARLDEGSNDPESPPLALADLVIPTGRPLPLPTPRVDLAAAIAALDEPLRRVQATLRRQAAKAQTVSE